MTQEQELYVTDISHEAYELASRCWLLPNQARCHVVVRTDNNNTPFYVVIVNTPEAMDRARTVRRAMFSS